MAKLTKSDHAILEEVLIAPFSDAQEERLKNIQYHTERWQHWSERDEMKGNWPAERWDPMHTAPSKGCSVLSIRIRTAAGKVIDDVHYAQDLSGEHQPPFRGWYNKDHVEVQPVEWQPMFVI